MVCCDAVHFKSTFVALRPPPQGFPSSLKRTNIMVCGMVAGCPSVTHRRPLQRFVAARVAAERNPAKWKVPRPDVNGRFGDYGGKYVPETLISALAELEEAYATFSKDPEFQVSPVVTTRSPLLLLR